MLQLIAAEAGICNHELARHIACEYPGERQAREPLVANHLTAFETAGIIVCRPVAVARDGRLIEGLRVTIYGRGRLEFLPKKARL